jgi:hypothetical protein
MEDFSLGRFAQSCIQVVPLAPEDVALAEVRDVPEREIRPAAEETPSGGSVWIADSNNAI